MPRKPDEVPIFLNIEKLATFCTVSPNHKPHAVPVFFTYADGKVYVQTARATQKIRNLLKNPHVTLAVYSGDQAVILRGTARIVDNEEFVKRTQEHIDKYGLVLDEQGRDSLGIPLFDSKKRCVVEVTPRRTIFW